MGRDDQSDHRAASSAEPSRLNPLAGWQPFTFGGVAVLAVGRSRRLMIIQLVLALLAIATVLSVILSDYIPVLEQALGNLPDTGRIERRELRVPLTGSRTLAENAFVAVLIELPESGRRSSTADVRVYFHRHRVELCSLFGCVGWAYPAGWTVEFNRTELKPQWGAWKPFVVVFLGGLMLVGLFGVWTVFGLLYSPVAYALARCARQPLSGAGAFRLASAALMPGAVLLTLGILLYGSAVINLVQLGGLVLVHFIFGWVYLLASPFFVRLNERLPMSAAKPPDAMPAPERVEGSALRQGSRNPFAVPGLTPRSSNPFAAREAPEDDRRDGAKTKRPEGTDRT